MKRFLPAALSILAVLMTSCGGRAHKPNVVLIVLDTLRGDRLSCMGYNRPTTPHIDAIAAQGTLYTHAFSTCFWTLPAHASLFSGDALDAVANGIAWFVLAVVPVVLIALFWLVHVMPEKIAHKRHHPQAEAIHTLCLLSLVFGGLLWPLAWLWAYTRPVAYRTAYGTDKHQSYHLDLADRLRDGTITDAERMHLRDELDAMQARGALPPELSGVREQLDAVPPNRPKAVEVNA